MEFEKYEDVIDAFEKGVGVEPGDTLTDYIRKNNIKIADPMPDNEQSGIMATDEATMMAEGPQQTDYRDPFLVEEYEKYLYDMMEQDLQPMSFEEFRRAAMAGMAKAQPEEVEEIKEKKVISLAGGGISELLEAYYGHFF